RDPPLLPPFPTRRSSDLAAAAHARIRAFLADKPTITGTLSAELAAVATEFEDLPLTVNIDLATDDLPSGEVFEFGGNGSEFGGRSEEHTSELQSPYDLVC